MIYGTLYSVTVDGFFEGITDDEDVCWDIVADATNGVKAPILDDDIPDRVEIQEIDINRYYKYGKNICDKLTGRCILCATDFNAIDGVKAFNRINLERERAEAKIRASLL